MEYGYEMAENIDRSLEWNVETCTPSGLRIKPDIMLSYTFSFFLLIYISTSRALRRPDHSAVADNYWAGDATQMCLIVLLHFTCFAWFRGTLLLRGKIDKDITRQQFGQMSGEQNSIF